MNFLRRLRPVLVIVIPACGGMNASGDAAVSIDVVAEDRAAPSLDVRGMDAADAPKISVNPPPPSDAGLLGFADVSDASTPPDVVVLAPDAPAPDVPSPDAPSPDAPSPDVPSPDVPSPDVPAPDAPAADVLPTDSGCAAGQRLCGGRCVDVGPHANACTPCGLPCCASASCRGGRCEVGCAPGWSVCEVPPVSATCEGGGICVPLQTDPRHCGQCGNVCPTGQSCREGACVP